MLSISSVVSQDSAIRTVCWASSRDVAPARGRTSRRRWTRPALTRNCSRRLVRRRRARDATRWSRWCPSSDSRSTPASGWVSSAKKRVSRHRAVRLPVATRTTSEETGDRVSVASGPPRASATTTATARAAAATAAACTPDGSSATASTPLCRPNSSEPRPSRAPRSIPNGTRNSACKSPLYISLPSRQSTSSAPPFLIDSKASSNGARKRELALALTLNFVLPSETPEREREFVPSVNCASHINRSWAERRKATLNFLHSSLPTPSGNPSSRPLKKRSVAFRLHSILVHFWVLIEATLLHFPFFFQNILLHHHSSISSSSLFLIFPVTSTTSAATPSTWTFGEFVHISVYTTRKFVIQGRQLRSGGAIEISHVLGYETRDQGAPSAPVANIHKIISVSCGSLVSPNCS